MGIIAKLLGKAPQEETARVGGMEDFMTLIRVYYQAVMAMQMGISNLAVLPDLRIFKQTLHVPTVNNKLGIGENGEVVVADTAWPRPSRSGKLEIYCQFKADNVNRTGLNSEPIKPYANYFVPNRGYQDTFADWDAR